MLNFAKIKIKIDFIICKRFKVKGPKLKKKWHPFIKI